MAMKSSTRAMNIKVRVHGDEYSNREEANFLVILPITNQSHRMLQRKFDRHHAL